jgi:hypothetical protein
MNIIGIDPSITSTGMTINGKLFSYSYSHKGKKKNGDLTKWFELCNPHVNLRFHEQAKFNNYEDEQVIKLKYYTEVVENILEDILNNIDKEEYTKIGIEGYSYGSSAGNLIDLVSFGTLLRDRLVTYISDDIIIVSPNSLKLETCKMVYEPIKIEKGKRKKKIVLEHRNNEGIAGGKFTKIEMNKAIIESNWEDNWVNHLKNVYSGFGKDIPKPYEDLNDSYLLYKYINFLDSKS